MLVAGDTSPLGWPYSAFTDADASTPAGALVFSASSSGIFGRNGGAITAARRRGRRAGRRPPHRRRRARRRSTADGCVVARATFAQGGEALVRACGTVAARASSTPTAEAPGGGAIRAFDTRVFAAGTDVVVGGDRHAERRHERAAAPSTAARLTELARSGVRGARRRDVRGVPAPRRHDRRRHRLPRDRRRRTGRALRRRTASSTRTIAGVGQASPVGGDFTSIGGGTLPSERAAARSARSSRPRAERHLRRGRRRRRTAACARSRCEGDRAADRRRATIRSFPSSIDPSIDGSGTRRVPRAHRRAPTDPPRPSGVFVKAPDGTITSITTGARRARGRSAP